MYKKKENLKYFLGGVAVGVTASFITGKYLLPNISTTEPQNLGNFKSQAGYSQDDNIHSSLYLQKNVQCYHPRSKSATRYENCIEQALPSKEQLKDSKDNFEENLNNLETEKKFHRKLNKLNINNISPKNEHYVLSEQNNSCENKKSGLTETSDKEISNMAADNFKNTLSAVNTQIVLEKSYNKSMNIDSQRVSGDPGELDILNSLSIEDNMLSSNLSTIQSTAVSPHMLQSFLSGAIEVEHLSDVATCNSYRNFEETGEEEADKSDLDLSNEFCENEPISSTKWTDSNNI